MCICFGKAINLYGMNKKLDNFYHIYVEIRLQ